MRLQALYMQSKKPGYGDYSYNIHYNCINYNRWGVNPTTNQ